VVFLSPYPPGACPAGMTRRARRSPGNTTGCLVLGVRSKVQSPAEQPRCVHGEYDVCVLGKYGWVLLVGKRGTREAKQNSRVPRRWVKLDAKASTASKRGSHIGHWRTPTVSLASGGQRRAVLSQLLRKCGAMKTSPERYSNPSASLPSSWNNSDSQSTSFSPRCQHVTRAPTSPSLGYHPLSGNWRAEMAFHGALELPCLAN